MSNKFWVDSTGRIELMMTYDTVYSSDSPDINYVSHTTKVPAGYVCIGGTAQVIISGICTDQSSPGAVLTIAGPTVGADAFNGWRGEAKAHLYGGYEIKLVVGVIGMRLKDGNGNYIPAEVLKQSLQLVSNTSAVGGHPSTFASVSPGYKLIGGGAQVNWSGKGNLLTTSHPDGNSWKVTSKDHGVVSHSSITSYAISIKKIVPNFGSLQTKIFSSCRNAPAGYQSMSVNIYNATSINNKYGVTSAGVLFTYTQNWGRLLTGIGSSGFNQASAFSKDHGWVDTGDLCAYAIGIRKGL